MDSTQYQQLQTYSVIFPCNFLTILAMCFVNSFFLLWQNVLITIQKLTKKQGYSYFIKLEEFFSAEKFISEIIDILLELKVNEIINFTFHLLRNPQNKERKKYW